MTKIVDSIASNLTELTLAIETTPGVLPVNGSWYTQEPNSYDDFGADLSMVARNPINSSRQRKKGTIVGLSASGGWEQDVTASNTVMLAEAFCFAAARRKSFLAATAILADGFTVPAGGAAYIAGTLLAARGSTVKANNGLKISTGGAANKVSVAGLTAKAEPATIQRVGFQFAAGDASIDVSGPLPAFVSAGVDLTTLGVIPGEIVYLGGDDAVTRFGGLNYGFCRIYSVAANAIVFDKTDAPYVADNGAGKTVRLFFGAVVKNESAVNSVYRTFALRRTLGRPDLDSPLVQSEVLLKSVADTMSFSMGTEDKITTKVSFMAGDYQTYKDDATAVGAIKVIDPQEDDAINTANDFVRSSMIVYPADGVGSAPKPVFAVFEEINLEIKNNISDNKAIGKLGTFALTPGQFEVSGDVTGYFVGVDAVQAVRDNSDVSFLMCMYKGGKGVAIDLPLIGLSTDGLNVSQDDPVMIPLDTQAASGKKYNPQMDHTLLMVFYDYLPRIAGN